MKSNHTSLFIAAGLMAGAAAVLSQPALQFNPVAYSTGENAGTVRLTVRRSGDPAVAVAVDYSFTDVTARDGTEYSAVPGTLTFAAGETIKTITVPLINDALVEPSRLFRVTLGNPSNGAVLGPSTTATVTILDPDKGISFRFSSYSVAEDVGAAPIGIARGDLGEEAMSVDLNTSDGTAVEGRDYAGLHQTLVLPADQRPYFVSIPILNNQIKDGTRTFSVTLSNPVDGNLGCTKTTSVAIADNDAGFEFDPASYTVGEDGGSVLIGVRRGHDDATTAVAVDYATNDGTGTAGADYGSASGTLAFAPGEKVKQIAIPILNDGIKESTKTFTVTLSHPTDSAELGPRASTTVSIQDNDPGIGLEAASFSVWAGAGELRLTVVRGSDATLVPFTVEYATAEGTAKAGEDYQPIAGVLEFDSNDMVKGLTIPILRRGGTGAARTFTITLSNPSGGGSLGIASASVRVEPNLATIIPPLSSGLAIREEAGAGTLSWSGGGRLQRADQVVGPWQNVSAAHSPWRLDPPSRASFYRLANHRSAPVYIPSNYDPATPMPLVFLFHGAGDSGQGVEAYMQFRPLAESRGFLYCYPDGSDIYGYRAWNGTDVVHDPSADWGAPIPDDAGYVHDLIEEIACRFAVDRKRIYMVGRSGGAAMAWRMGAQFANLVAGLSAQANSGFFDPRLFVPSEPVHVLYLQSVAGDYWGVAPTLCDGFFANAIPFPSAERTIRDWASYNGADQPQTDPDPSLDLILDVQGPDTVITRYLDHPPGGAVELWTLIGGPHKPSLGPNYSPAIVDWLLAHPKP